MPHPGRLYPQSLSQSTVLRYYCRYFCCHCACCCPCYPCCCPCYPCYPCFVLADCSAIVFKNEIKMVLPIAETRLSGDVRGTGRREGVGCGRSGGDLPRPAPCALSVVRKAATKAVKIADYNRGFPHRTQLFIIAACPPPLCFSSLPPLFSLHSWLFLLATLGSLTAPLLLPSGHPSDTTTTDATTFSFLSRLSFHCAASPSPSSASASSSSFYFYSTRAKTFVFVRAFCMSFSSPFPPIPLLFSSHSLSHFLPRLLPLCLLPLESLYAVCCPLLLFVFCLFCALFRCAFYFSLPPPSSSSSALSSRYLPPRFSNLLICELLCSHYNSFCFVSCPSPFFAFRWGIQASCLLRGYWGGPGDTLYLWDVWLSSWKALEEERRFCEMRNLFLASSAGKLSYNPN